MAGADRYDGITGFYLGVVPSTFDIPERPFGAASVGSWRSGADLDPSADNTGVRAQVLRRQPDGSWLRIMDRPEVPRP